MSNSTYNKMWVDTHEDLEYLLKQEINAQVAKPQTDRVIIFQMLVTFYVKYVQIFRSMEVLYDQIVHPQKRRVIHHVLDGVMGRILELKNEMVKLEFSEYHYCDDVLQDLKLTPEDLEIPIPGYFVKDKLKVLKIRQNILEQILSETSLPVEQKRVVKVLTLEEAIQVIQISERARQGRLRAKFMLEIRMQEEKDRLSKYRAAITLAPEIAATRIQKVWRGYTGRKIAKKERAEEMIFIEMAPPPNFEQLSPAHLQAQKTVLQRHVVQEVHEVEYQEALITLKEQVRAVEGMDIKETLQDQIRQWFIECRNTTGRFPNFPDAEKGGSAAIFATKTPEEVLQEFVTQGEKKKKKKEKKDKNEKKKKKKKGKANKEEEEDGWKIAESHFLPTIKEGQNTFEVTWKNRNEDTNFSQKYVTELIKEEKRKEVEEEIRVQVLKVDELMRQELKNLKLAVDRDKGSKKKGGKKKKAKKGKKKKKEKDLTLHRTINSLYEELIREGLLIRPRNVRLSDFIGEYNYLGTTLRQTDIEPMPSLSDVRQLISLYGILPLGSQAVHEKAPLVKSLLLAGPSGVGKKMLVHALCTETGANLFNLSPHNTAGKYPGKIGLKMMIHMVFKVARMLQPSVVWIDNAEKVFYKKVPKMEKELEPKRLKKSFPKILKSIKAEDRVLIVGTSQRPFDAELKTFCRGFQKIVLIPRPDYTSRFVLWRNFIQQNGGILTTSLDLSSLAKVTDGYTQGHLSQAAKYVLTEQRIKQLHTKPLTAVEFITPLARQDPVFKEEEETFKDWYAKTSLGKKRARAAKEQGSDKGKEKGKKGKKEKKKGKKKK
ncbi:dynein regulatory complex protein 11 isoform X3 [Chiloscyllium plagiosum]|uniref:dynein regulatory complex protein 11 isoform X3 n=1 Tax=Chiloscyllium plagiosum TaxID=36176 RepID=UPI001CB8587D|nr:dynein regulatory complex protein 11 isoform X3 [Chiloscyllium plagiosum]